MFKLKKLTLLTGLVALGSPLVQAEDIIFFQDFGCQSAADNGCTPSSPQTWNSVPNSTSYTYSSENQAPNSVSGPTTEYIRSDTSTRFETNPSNFSVTGQNWDIHNGSDNTYVSGYRTPNGTTNFNMQGEMLGHEDENYDSHEDNFYQIDGIKIASNITEATLMFDFDSWISGSLRDYYGNWHTDVDGFAVGYAAFDPNNPADIDSNSQFSLLNPIMDESDMQYRLLGRVNDPNGSIGDKSLNRLVGESTADDAEIWGFDGHAGGNDKMAGTAMFDLSGLAGQTISLRFAFASNNAYHWYTNSDGSWVSRASVEEGINIDNIKVTQVCVSGNSPGCNPPGGGEVPEPGSLALALLGLTLGYRRRKAAA